MSDFFSFFLFLFFFFLQKIGLGIPCKLFPLEKCQVKLSGKGNNQKIIIVIFSSAVFKENDAVLS